VRGTVGVNEGSISLPLGPHPTKRLKQKVDFGQGKSSSTYYKIVPPSSALFSYCQHLFGDQLPSSTFLELHPVTGRTHQLRVHLSHVGHPIIGDSLYDPITLQRLHEVAPRLCLHAMQIAVRHPHSNEDTEYSTLSELS
jgi:tRNA pseudouridine32 synthase/23S rRNA pseudouridine746 synthase